MRTLIAIILALVISLVGVGFLYRHTARENTELSASVKDLQEAQKQAQAALKLNAAVLGAREKQIAVQARKFGASQASLYTALQANKTWSDTYVPSEVQKVLYVGSEAPDTPSGVGNNPVVPAPDGAGLREQGRDSEGYPSP
jgi:uncharacterized protein HemX